MRITHLGPPMKRGGGPPGYLLELSRAAAAGPETGHEVEFPELAPSNGAHLPPTSSATIQPTTSTTLGLDIRARCRSGLSVMERLLRWRRRFIGPPRQYRPSPEALSVAGGPVSRLIEESKQSTLRQGRASLEKAKAGSKTDVLFAHDCVTADSLIQEGGGEQVWLMQHSPIPLGLYLAWNWGVPEAPWEEVACYPDVRASLEWELSIYQRVDRLVLPCLEALGELSRVDPRFGGLRDRCDFILTGVSEQGLARDVPPSAARNAFGLPGNEKLALFLGNAQAYRGLDALLESLRYLPASTAGRLVVAGTNQDSLGSRPRLESLGRVEDVPLLLRAVDFVVNTNRFSLLDLSLLEALRSGKPLLLHAVGGNKTLESLGAGCRLFASLDPRSIAGELDAMFSAPDALFEELGGRSRACYQTHLTAADMWQRHLDLYDRAASEKELT